ncbi:endonuclease [Flavobacterium sp.]|uniref:endonuclease n=1 Tax=Flavobacterium sp. TaxID=239 RepID=UPI0037C15BAF
MMKKYFLFVQLFIVVAGFSQQAYYNPVNLSTNGQVLKNQLAQLISSTHDNFLTYTPGVWNALKIVDLDPSNSNNVLLIYGWENGTDGDVSNDLFRNKESNGGNNGEWNREHVYAQSLGTPDLGSTGPGADAHMLRACDVQRNNTRGNRKFAAGSGNSATTGINWYPGDQWKGDVARIIMYMYVRYGDQCLPTNIGVGSTTGTGDSMIDLFLTWNAQDPVSTYEVNRNTYLGNANNTYGQGNRNPFIDNPYLATKIWGGTPAQDIWGTLSTTALTAFDFVVYPNPTTDHKINIDSDAVLDEIILINVNGQIMQQIQKPSALNQTYTIDNLPTGFYFLKVTADNQSVTKKILVN